MRLSGVTLINPMKQVSYIMTSDAPKGAMTPIPGIQTGSETSYYLRTQIITQELRIRVHLLLLMICVHGKFDVPVPDGIPSELESAVLLHKTF